MGLLQSDRVSCLVPGMRSHAWLLLEVVMWALGACNSLFFSVSSLPSEAGGVGVAYVMCLLPVAVA